VTPEQSRRKLREGCATHAGCVALPALTIVMIVVGAALNRTASTRLIPRASFDVPFAHVERTAGYVLLVTGAVVCICALSIALGWRRSRLLGIVVCVLAVPLAVWIELAVLYDQFIALAAREGAVRLIHRWPRGDVVLSATDVDDVESEQVANTDMQPWRYRLWISAKGKRYRSEETKDSSMVRRAMLLIAREQRMQEIRGGDDATRIQMMGRLALVQIDLGQNAAARSTAEQALTLAARRGDDLGIASAHFALGTLDHHDKRYPQAEEHYRRSLGIRRMRLDSDHPDLHDVVDAYAALLDATGRPEEAGEIRRLAAPRTLVSELRRKGLTLEEAEARVRALVEARREK
jgi:hypothetical protein